MAKSNGHCGVGVAYSSRIGGELYVQLTIFAVTSWGPILIFGTLYLPL